MDLFYINLAERADRRNLLEANFAANNASQWRLFRIEAVTAQSVAANRVPGTTRAAEKGCFLSHLKAIQAARESADHAFIAEDDILFGTKSIATVERALATIPEKDWDLIYTDATITNVNAMVELFQLRRKLAQTDASTLLDLIQMPFCGAMAYIVNRGAKEKILRALPGAGPFDISYDLCLRELVRNRVLRAYTIFPFPTSQSALGDISQVQLTDDRQIDTVWASFRRLVWQERDIASAVASLERAIPRTDPESAAIARVLAAALAPDWRIK